MFPMPHLSRWPLGLTAALVVLTAVFFVRAYTGHAEQDTGIAQFPPVIIQPDHLAALVASTSTDQQTLISDGTVTFAEYKAAVSATVGCLRNAKVHVFSGPLPDAAPSADPVLTSRGWYIYAADPASNSAQAPAVEDCRHQHSDIVEAIWRPSTLASLDELQAARDAISVCLHSSKIDAPEHPSALELYQIAFPGGLRVGNPDGAYGVCAERAAQEFNIPGFVG